MLSDDDGGSRSRPDVSAQVLLITPVGHDPSEWQPLVTALDHLAERLGVTTVTWPGAGVELPDVPLELDRVRWLSEGLGGTMPIPDLIVATEGDGGVALELAAEGLATSVLLIRPQMQDLEAQLDDPDQDEEWESMTTTPISRLPSSPRTQQGSRRRRCWRATNLGWTIPGGSRSPHPR